MFYVYEMFICKGFIRNILLFSALCDMQQEQISLKPLNQLIVATTGFHRLRSLFIDNNIICTYCKYSYTLDLASRLWTKYGP